MTSWLQKEAIVGSANSSSTALLPKGDDNELLVALDEMLSLVTEPSSLPPPVSLSVMSTSSVPPSGTLVTNAFKSPRFNVKQEIVPVDDHVTGQHDVFDSPLKSGFNARLANDDSLFVRTSAFNDNARNADDQDSSIKSRMCGDVSARSEHQAQIHSEETKRVKKPRKRQKDELDYLRVKVKEMEEELEKLRSVTSDSSHTSSDTFTTTLSPSDNISPSGTVKTTLPSMVTTMWKQIATHQMEAATRSTIENMRLRALLENQLQVVRNLETAFLKRQKCEGSRSMTRSKLLRAASMTDTVIFSTLGHDLDKRYEQVDAIFSECRLVNLSMEKNVVGTQLKSDENGVYFEHIDAVMVPFPLHVLARTMWDYITTDKFCIQSIMKFETHHVDDDGNTIYGVGVDTINLPTAAMPIKVHLVLRRYVSSQRVVIVAESMSTIDGCELRLRDKAWVSYSQLPSDSNATIAKFCVRVTPDLEVFDAEQDVEVGVITNLVINSARRNLRLMHQMVESVLQSAPVE